MVYVVPILYRARKNFTARGQDFVVGQTLTSAEAKSIGRLGVLVSGGYLLAEPDTSNRRAYQHLGPQPTYIHPDVYDQLPPDVVVATGVTVTPATVSLVIGATSQLSAALVPADAEGTIVWTSTGPGTATVSATGLVTALSVGYVDALATVEGTSVSGLCDIEVTSVEVVQEKAPAPRKRKSKTDTVGSTGQEEPAS